MAPTSKKLKGQIGLGLFVCPSIYPSPLKKKFTYSPPTRLKEKQNLF